MKVLVVRINRGTVFVDSKPVSSAGCGLALFVGIDKEDNSKLLASMAEKVVNFRIFEDEQGKMNLSLKDKKYGIICISNFTLCANSDRGRRPSFENAMAPDEANNLFEVFVLMIKSKGIDVKTGEFGKYMNIDLEMNGPVNILLSS